MSVCDADKVISSGGGDESVLFHAITFHKGEWHWGGQKTTDPGNCFKMTTFLFSWMGPNGISCHQQSECIGMLYGFLIDRSRDRETGWGKDAEKIASQIVAAQKAFAAEIRLWLSPSLLCYDFNVELCEEASQTPLPTLDKNLNQTFLPLSGKHCIKCHF